MSFRIELFAIDLDRSIRFYEGALGFVAERSEADYASLRRGASERTATCPFAVGETDPFGMGADAHARKVVIVVWRRGPTRVQTERNRGQLSSTRTRSTPLTPAPAQPDPSGWGTGGRRFKSCLPH